VLLKNFLHEKQVTNAKTIAGLLHGILRAEDPLDQDKEHFWVIGLTGNNMIKYIELVTLGILNSCLVHPREIFRRAVTQGVNSIMLAHNHPGGQLKASINDLTTSQTLVAAGQILGILIIDHIIIDGRDGFLSLNEKGILNS